MTCIQQTQSKTIVLSAERVIKQIDHQSEKQDNMSDVWAKYLAFIWYLYPLIVIYNLLCGCVYK